MEEVDARCSRAERGREKSAEDATLLRRLGSCSCGRGVVERGEGVPDEHRVAVGDGEVDGLLRREGGLARSATYNV